MRHDVQEPGLPTQTADPLGHRPAARDYAVTTTGVGILLIVLCVLLWAIMAALHRHTVQLEALEAQMDALLNAQQSKPSRPAERALPGRSDHGEHRTAHASSERA